MKLSKDGHKIIMKRKDFVQCYFTMRPLLKKYFSGSITTSDFVNQLEHIYKIWFA